MKSFDYNSLWKKNKLKQYREQNKYTQEHIASFLNISQQQYQKYESGNLQPSVILVAKLADFYNISVQELCGIDNIKSIGKE